ncbi:hypothetical protein [Nocardia asteroides]|uniref:hypothetical protein n=1 Tax=Nocardia asteroides TaxID=1824 RepID=UPI001E59C3D8|nr:hypothetical protein [Nocardia asteroides]UGT60354.1 hypothetical protein LTT61_24620 [Nocardia asteroides]
MITPIVPPQSPLHELLHGPALAPVVATSDPDVVYGMSTLGEAGRLVDKPAFTSLGWGPGTRLSLTVPDFGLLLACPDPDGPVVMTAAGFLRIPYRLRRRASLFSGDRALLVGHRVHDRLLIHAPVALDRLFAESLLRLTEACR